MTAVVANLARNDLSSVPHRQSVGDAFEVLDALGQTGERYDVVVVDPPAFASKASERDRAIRAYRKLTELALPLIRPGGRLFQASCSSRVTEDALLATIRSAVAGQGRSLEDTKVFSTPSITRSLFRKVSTCRRLPEVSNERLSFFKSRPKGLRAPKNCAL